MTSAANKRSIMTLFSNKSDIYCHQVRIVLAEKGVNAGLSCIKREKPFINVTN